ncbi:LysR family transcriptional regulator [Cohaesibacter gelatinilyticus]|uniref:Transcriptional regulator, LysR family n=1 Tax=Cohaesibacter gelatinilyticus TaxID=372072 RepID=A0A285PGF6_9HYPH|nr:LysR family transcriptional regulator [Cohaesibacter gelatinilyticus]SNZ19226.1 transcriptional regulator, LysR family [Cohaesibacter gelatinilyticus]
MQLSNWDDYRILLALARAKSLSGAASLLGLNATTISRRIKAMESRVGSTLITRDKQGSTFLTQLGQAIADHAENMEQHAHAADALIGHETPLSGTVRVTAVPFLLNRLLMPWLAEFSAEHPGLNVSLIPDSKNLSLSRREADIALRFGDPEEGGDAVLAQKIGSVVFSVFTAKTKTQLAYEERPWLGYDPIATHLPQAKWTQDLAQQNGGVYSNLLMHDLETAFEAALATRTRALLPVLIARQDSRMIELPLPSEIPTMKRDVWLLRNKDMRGVERVDAAIAWLTNANMFQ